MPIKPENKKLYPYDWKAIRAEVLERAGHKCEFCLVPNYAIGYRDSCSNFIEVNNSHQSDLDAEENGWKIIKIVLTISHLDHDPSNNGVTGNRPNLATLCQKHHLQYDANHHAKNSRKTRDEKAGRVPMEF